MIIVIIIIILIPLIANKCCRESHFKMHPVGWFSDENPNLSPIKSH